MRGPRISRAVLAIALLLTAPLSTVARPEVGPVAEEPAPPERLADGVELIYWHATFRCDYCLGMERDLLACLSAEFAAPVAEGLMRWHSLDYEESINAELAGEYGIEGQDFLVVRRMDGVDAELLRIEEIWDAAGAEARCERLLPVLKETLRRSPRVEASTRERGGRE